MKTTFRVLAILVSLGLASLAVAQQPQLDLPRPSPNATVSQTVGVTNITVTYSRPGVKGRVIWGGLVPYDQNWRTGANEATTLTLTGEAIIGGTKIPAGTYGIFTIPGKDEWTVVINKNSKQWGNYEYKQEEDVVRLKVKPQAAELEEWMRFSFANLTVESADLVLTWEKLRVAIPIKVETVSTVLVNARKAVAEAKADDWRTPYRAAAFCLDNNVNLAEAKGWLDKSFAAKPTLYNLTAKARVLFIEGKKADAIAAAKQAIVTAKAADPKVDTAMTEALIKEWEKK
jgi:Protein of unknown function (DUF2911)